MCGAGGADPAAAESNAAYMLGVMVGPVTRCRLDVVAVGAAAPRIGVGALLRSSAIGFPGGHDGFGEQQASAFWRPPVPA